MMLFLAFFGLVGVGLVGSPAEARTVFGVLTALAIVMPLIGIRALFGNHVWSTIALTGLGLLFLIGGYVADFDWRGASHHVCSRAGSACARRGRVRVVEVGNEEPLRRLADRELMQLILNFRRQSGRPSE